MIQLIDVHKSYTKDHETIKGVSFEVHEGQIFGLLGPNGAGKTTLMQMIATLMKPTSGEIIIDGLSGEKNLLEIHRKIGFLTNEIKLDPLSTPNILFDFFAKLYDIPAAELKDRRDEEGQTRAHGSEANSFVLKKALVYMLEHFTSKLTLGDVAQQCYVSSWHLSKLLNQYTGRGFFEIINQIRIDEAKQLLTGTADRVSDIAEAVGFLDVAHFSRIFKTFTKVSPKEYRSGQKPLSLDK